jgi:transposase
MRCSRARTLTKARKSAKADDIVRLAAGGMKREEIAARLGVGIASVYRMLAERWASMLPS